MPAEKRRPLVADVKRNSLDDGPGIRSVVFFKGCPLSCVWCHNPECIDPRPEILFRPDPCIGCAACRDACPESAIGKEGPSAIDRAKCTACGACVEECPSGALSLVGKYYEPDELVEALARDTAFFDNSGGGVTLSGGEPTLHMDYAGEVARRLKERGIHVCVETCGDFEWGRFAEKLLPHVSLIYVDLKIADDAAHKRFTRRGNAGIQRNIARILALGDTPSLVRVPLVPGVTSTRKNFDDTARWLVENGVKRVALLPYNPLWLTKARGLGRCLAYDRSAWMTQEERAVVKQAFEGFEIERDI